MVVSINATWKVPAGYFFIQNLNGEQKTEISNQCVTAPTRCGIVISNITFDGCPTNFNVCHV